MSPSISDNFFFLLHLKLHNVCDSNLLRQNTFVILRTTVTKISPFFILLKTGAVS